MAADIGPTAAEARIRRAIREASSHPSVVAIGLATTLEDGTTEVVLEVDSNLPSHWRARGQSDNGVRATEPVTFSFRASFPLEAPKVTLRGDFDRSHPHLQPRQDGVAEPCLVHGSVPEMIQSRGMLGLVDQLAEWLEKASTVDLIDPKQGWEPTRRDNLADVLAVDRSLLQALPVKDAGGRAFETIFVGVGRGKAFYLRAFRTRASIGEQGFPNSYRKDGNRYSGKTLTLTCWSGRLPSGVPFVANRYMPEDVHDIASLHARAKALGCGTSLADHLALLARVEGTSQRLPIPVGIVLLARRPYPLIDTGSPIELCSYVLEYHAGDDLTPSGTAPVRPAAQRDELSLALLRTASGEDVEEGTSWSLLGCGSVGSKLASHMARCGRPPGIVVDRSIMAPHNFGRHGLLPATDVDHLGFSPKAQLLADALSALGTGVRGVVDDVVVSGEMRRKSFWRDGPGMLVNATGSLVVREALATMDVGKCRPPVVESCLLAGGRVGYLTVEGHDGNPSTGDLAAEAYRMVASDRLLSTSVFDSAAQAVAVGQGCSSVTFPMPDALLSAMTAPMAMRLSEIHRRGMPADGGEVMLGRLSEDGYGQEWQRTPVPRFKTVESPDGWTCRVSARVMALMRAEIAVRPGVETGGVIVGRWSDMTKSFCVVDLVPPPPDSVFSAVEFVLGVEGLASNLRAYVSRSGGSLQPLGTWHSHLRPSGPSSKDFATGILMADLQVAPAFMVICAPDKLHAFVTEVDASP